MKAVLVKVDFAIGFDHAGRHRHEIAQFLGRPLLERGEGDLEQRQQVFGADRLQVLVVAPQQLGALAAQLVAGDGQLALGVCTRAVQHQRNRQQ